MSPKTLTLLSEKHIYVSWTILLAIIGLTIMAVDTRNSVKDVPKLVEKVQLLETRVSILEYKDRNIELLPN